MNPQQQTAFDSPCREAIECSDVRFFRSYRSGGNLVTVGVTLNVGLE
jgi:hypothetical protein